MRIAVTYENGQIFPHFGHREQFKMCDAAVEAFLKDELSFQPDVRCSHHGEEHRETCGNCESHKCGMEI